jgi:hypothetical protein
MEVEAGQDQPGVGSNDRRTIEVSRCDPADEMSEVDQLSSEGPMDHDHVVHVDRLNG